MSTLLLREINSGGIKVLNINDKTPEGLENMWEFLCNLLVGTDLLKMSPNPHTKEVSLINLHTHIHWHAHLYTYVHISVQI